MYLIKKDSTEEFLAFNEDFDMLWVSSKSDAYKFVRECDVLFCLHCSEGDLYEHASVINC